MNLFLLSNPRLLSPNFVGLHDEYAELPRLTVDITYPSEGPQRLVGADKTYTTLQSAIDAANLGDVIIIDMGYVMPEFITLPNKTGSGYIIIRSAAPPTAGVRVTAAGLISGNAPRISRVPTGGVELITCATGAHHYRFVGILVKPLPLPLAGDGSFNEIFAAINCTDPSPTPTLASQPHHIIFDRCAVATDAPRLRRGISFNVTHGAIIHCDVADAHDLVNTGPPNNWYGNGDTQALWVYEAAGPLHIENNSLTSAGENVLFGGTDPRITDLVPSDITFIRNKLLKPLAYQGVYAAKNCLELKNVQRMLIEGNVLDGSWPAGQNGTLILFQSVNQSGSAPWSGVRDITVRKNFGRNAQHLFGLARYQDNPAAFYQARISIQHNVAVNIAALNYDGDDSAARMFLIGGLSQLTIRHNTMLAAAGTSAGAVYFGITVPCIDTDILDNISANGNYGVHGEGIGSLPAALAFFLTDNGGSLEYNVYIETNPDNIPDYPTSNQHPATLAAVGFVNASITATWETADPDAVCAALQLSGASAYKNSASDGTDPGANMAAVRAAIMGVV